MAPPRAGAERRRVMRKQIRVLGLAGGGDPRRGLQRLRRRRPHGSAPARRPVRGAGVERRPRRGAGQRVAGRRGGDRPAAAPVGAAGPVRRLLRGRQAGLLRGRGPDRRDARRAARRSSRRQVGSAAGRPRVHDLLGARRSSRPARRGSDLVDIAQIFQRSGTLSVSWKDDAASTTPCKLAGKKVGVWDFGNEFEVTAGLRSTAA